jgi:hypothetical protein
VLPTELALPPRPLPRVQETLPSKILFPLLILSVYINC